jgi:hypothetical protein
MILASSLFSFTSAAAAILLMVKARDFKFNVRPCEVCGERDGHLVGCPGRRGY